ncbi:MAG: sulfite exporter TauE/SafE family protein [Melioribacteraceae bacterium]|nr:sulfite exporter TauE/SafE family protein [Melioribacteraceae bacterium]
MGTILTLIFMIFFPVDLAIALTGVVHFFNSIFKLVLVGKKADTKILLFFGISAVLAAILGSWLLLSITDLKPLFIYEINGNTFEIFPVKLIISILLICFTIIDFIPFFNKLEFSKNMLPVGGALSGFFGGLSGNQGALRSAFLIKAGLSKESFISTAVVVSIFVDLTRLTVYATRFTKAGLQEILLLVVIATLATIAVAFIGNKLLKKVTLKFIQILVAIMLILISVALGTGWI